MQRDRRRAEIIDATLRIAAREGFGAATVRRIGRELGMSAGNIHHLFASSGEMKCEAFTHFAVENHARACAMIAPLPVAERLEALIRMSDVDAAHDNFRVWHEAAREAGQDAAFGEAFAAAIGTWQSLIADVLRSACSGPVPAGRAEAAAWRLIAATMGFDNFVQSRQFAISAEDAAAYMREMIGSELRAISALVGNA